MRDFKVNELVKHMNFKIKILTNTKIIFKLEYLKNRFKEYFFIMGACLFLFNIGECIRLNLIHLFILELLD